MRLVYPLKMLFITYIKGVCVLVLCNLLGPKHVNKILPCLSNSFLNYERYLIFEKKKTKALKYYCFTVTHFKNRVFQ